MCRATKHSLHTTRAVDPDPYFKYGLIRIRSKHPDSKSKIKFFFQHLLTKVEI